MHILDVFEDICVNCNRPFKEHKHFSNHCPIGDTYFKGEENKLCYTCTGNCYKCVDCSKYELISF